MDRKIEKKKWSVRSLVIIAGISCVIIFITYAGFTSGGGTTLNIDPNRVVISGYEMPENQTVFSSERKFLLYSINL